MAKRIGQVALAIIAVVLMVVAFAGVISNQGERDNRVINTVNLDSTDKYMADEVVRVWYGNIGLSNVEEFGTNNSKVSAIIHYENTTNYPLTLAPSDLGTFMDDGFDYRLKGIKDVREKYEPGDSAEFRVYIERDDGLKGLTYLLSEPERNSELAEENQIVYRSSIDLNMLNKDEEAKAEFYGMSPNYNENIEEDTVGRDAEHVALIETIEEIILSTEDDEEATKAEEERIKKLEQDRKDALRYLESKR